MTTRRTRSVQLRTFIAAAATNDLASTVAWMQPLIMSYLVLHKGMQPSAAGLLLTCEVAAQGLAGFVAARFAPRAYILAVGGTLVAIAGSLATLFLSSYESILLVRVITGLGAGAAIVLANVVAANFADPARFFGRVMGTTVVLGFLMLGLSPYVAAHVSENPYATVFLAMLVLLPLALVLPRTVRQDLANQVKSPDQGLLPDTPLAPASGRHVALLVLITFMITVSSGTMWGLYGLLGERAGIASDVISRMLTVAAAAGAVGVLLPAVIGTSLGRIAPFCTALVLMAVAVLVTTSQPSAAAFRIAVCIPVAAIYVIVPYLSSLAMALDPRGKAAAYVFSTFLCGNACAPLLGGVLISNVDVQTIGRIVVVLSLLGAAIYVYIARTATTRSGN